LQRLLACGGILRRRDRASAADHRRRAWVQAPGSRAVVVRQLHQGELRVSAAVVVGRRSRARAKVRAKARAGGPAPSPTTYTPYRTRRLQIRRTLATSLHLCAIVRLPPRAWRDVLSVQRLCASISRACLRVVCVMSAPPSMGGIASTRSLRSIGSITLTVVVPTVFFVTRQ